MIASLLLIILWAMIALLMSALLFDPLAGQWSEKDERDDTDP